MGDIRKAPTGLEMMLRNLGLGEVIQAAQQLASAGTIEKILKFADGVEELNARLDRIELALADARRAQERSFGDYLESDAKYIAFVKQWHEYEARSDAADGGPVNGGPVTEPLGRNDTDPGPGISGEPSRGVDDGSPGDIRAA